jgi:hypothetical protein
MRVRYQFLVLGYVLVPRVPTKAMLDAAWAEALAEDAAGVWREMVEQYEESVSTATEIRIAGEADSPAI